jgi:hypothetical protein
MTVAIGIAWRSIKFRFGSFNKLLLEDHYGAKHRKRQRILMNKKNIILLAFATLVGMFFLIAVSFVIFTSYKQYVRNPPVSTVNAEKCSVNGLVAHWRFDEIVDGATPDSSDQHNIGRFKYWFRDQTRFIFGAPKVVKGIDGDGLEFKGRQWVSGGNNSCFTTETFTISAWVWQDRDDKEVPTIMSKSSWTSSDGWWLCSTTKGVLNQGKSRDIDVGIAWGSGFTHVKSGYQLPLREWHHIAVSMDNTRHEAQFYIDGKIFGAKHKNVPNWLVNWNHDLFLGEYDGSGRWPWFGKLDDVRFYNKVLSNTEAQAIFSSRFK